jgi:hypothetical protein
MTQRGRKVLAEYVKTTREYIKCEIISYATWGGLYE